MENSKPRVLLNAEPFGFGPTAAIAAFFPFLRAKFPYLAYVGRGLTLDLQSALPYDAIYDLDKENSLEEIFAQHDFFVTALDFEMATKAKQAGLKVAIYDPLTWYWKELPNIISECDLYMAQDFFGVRERIKKDPPVFSKTKVVSPIVPSELPSRTSEIVLLNMGGLQNPIWTSADAVSYARRMVKNVRSVLPTNMELVIATSSGIVQSLGDTHLKSYDRAAMLKLLARTKCAFMTPGLGNIYDAAYFGIPTAWLPPANDSQGQQLLVIEGHGCTDAILDWRDITAAPIDYHSEQVAVLKQIADAIQMRSDAHALACFASAYEKINNMSEGSARRILNRFGKGGAQEVASLIIEHV